jgi:hypothetical protein
MPDLPFVSAKKLKKPYIMLFNAANAQYFNVEIEW